MDKIFDKNIKHLFISPFLECNLNCKICYVKKNKSKLDINELKKFITRFIDEIDLKVITFCGGEILLDTKYIDLINYLVEKYNLFIQIVTNGTVDNLSLFNNPNNINLIVSLDGLPIYHDLNRGKGNFEKSFNFLKKAKQLGFHTEIFSILTQENYLQINNFEKLIKSEFGKIDITYHPRKPLEYLKKHPKDNILGQVKDFSFLTLEQMRKIYSSKRKIFPPKKLNCYQVSIFSDGKIYGCCEGITSIGTIKSDISQVIISLKKNIICGCCEYNFMCGIKKYIK